MLVPLKRWAGSLFLVVFLCGFAAAVLFGGTVQTLPGYRVGAPAPGASTDTERAPELEVIPAAYRTEQTSFAVAAGEDTLRYRVFGLFVMPGEALPFRITGAAEPEAFAFEPSGGTTAERAGGWTWTAPAEPGVVPIRIVDERSGELMRLNVFVMQPFGHDTAALDGYRIGNYERVPLRNDPVYNPPEGFVRVTPENHDLLVAPHFTLGQFLCKQASDWPKYLVLDESLLLKLELILRRVNERGIAARTLHVMSGYRTPFYNRSIGNETSYSRHLFGDAADIFVDDDEDGRMDDLTGDGEVTRADAALLADIAQSVSADPEFSGLLGGTGIYGPAPHRGPFVHVDVRGSAATW